MGFGLRAMAIFAFMKTMSAGKFKDECFKTLDAIAGTKETAVIAKCGRPVAKLIPYAPPSARRGLAGSVLKELGSPFSTLESWRATATRSS